MHSLRTCERVYISLAGANFARHDCEILHCVQNDKVESKKNMIKSKLYFDTTEPVETEHSISLIADFDGNEEAIFVHPLEAVIPILPLRNMVLFPGIVLPVSVGRKSSLRLIKDAFKQEKAIGVFCQRSSETEEPQQKDLYETGTAARVVRIFEMPDQTTTVILQGMQRLRLTNIVSTRPYLMGEAEALDRKSVV